MYKIAAVQMTSTRSLNQNLDIAANLIEKSKKSGAELVVLPEIFPLFGENHTDKISIKEPHGCGDIQTFLSDQAKSNNIWIVGGTIPLESDNPNKIRAASLVFDTKGNEVARYDKVHLFDAHIQENELYNESYTTDPGDRAVVVQTPVGMLGLSVCYDIRFPELYRKLLDNGAEIIVIPSAFTVPTGIAHWEVLTRARAIENLSYVVAACQGGAHENGRETYGNSVIISPWGEVIARLDQATSDIIIGNIDLAYLRDCRKKIPIEKHRAAANFY